MHDVAEQLARTVSGNDAYGNPITSHALVRTLMCGLRMINTAEVQGSGNVPVADAELRVPLSIALQPTDRVRVTHRYGTLQAQPLLFEVIAFTRGGATGNVYALKVVTDGQGQEQG